jgi:hypothetical protein
MAERASIFDSGEDFDVGGFTPQKPKPTAPAEKVRQVSEAASFKSREPEPRRAKREPRRYRTGRNTQFNIKADPDVIEEFYRITDAKDWVLGETLERAVSALKKELAAEAAGTKAGSRAG